MIRAPRGYGGTRMLEEVELALAPARSLYLATAGAEPLGALRRAFSRSVITGIETMSRRSDAERLGLWRLLSGDGIDLPTAAELIVAHVARGSAVGALLVDDLMEIDDPSLEAVAAALRRSSDLRCYVRFEGDDPLPASLERFAIHQEVKLEALPRAATAELLHSLSSGALLPHATKRLALRALY
ncbi:MAG TPA: hypothetical protein VGL13_05630, partial [Polyangiaceae bacterium]